MRIEVEYIEPLPANAQLTLEAAVRYFQACCDGVNPDAILDSADPNEFLYYHGIDNLVGGRAMPFETPRWDVSPQEKLHHLMETLNGKNRNYSLRKLEHSFTQHAKEFGDIDTEIHQKVLAMYMIYQSVVQSFQKKNFDCFSRKDKVYLCIVDDERGTRQKFLTTPAQLHFTQWYISYGVYEYIESFSDEITAHMQAKRSMSRSVSASAGEAGEESAELLPGKKRRRKAASNSEPEDIASTLQRLATERFEFPSVF